MKVLEKAIRPCDWHSGQMRCGECKCLYEFTRADIKKNRYGSFYICCPECRDVTYLDSDHVPKLLLQELNKIRDDRLKIETDKAIKFIRYFSVACLLVSFLLGFIDPGIGCIIFFVGILSFLTSHGI